MGNMMDNKTSDERDELHKQMLKDRQKKSIPLYNLKLTKEEINYLDTILTNRLIETEDYYSLKGEKKKLYDILASVLRKVESASVSF